MRIGGLLLPEEVLEVRAIARDELASMCGLALRRLQDYDSKLEPKQALSAIFGELLYDLGGTDKLPGA